MSFEDDMKDMDEFLSKVEAKDPNALSKSVHDYCPDCYELLAKHKGGKCPEDIKE